MEGWRQGDHSAERKLSHEEQEQIHLTPTGLLMEGDNTQNPVRLVNECIEMHRQYQSLKP
jgi:hypothetical protein